MQRFSGKRRTAWGMAAGASAAALALLACAPAQASARAAAQDPTTFTVDYSHTTIPGNPVFGATFVGNGIVTDESGNQVGTADDHCDEDSVSLNSVTVQCSSVITFPDGELHIVTLAPIPDLQTAYPYSFDGIVQGGTGAYDGASGDAHLTATEPGVYQVTLQLQ